MPNTRWLCEHMVSHMHEPPCCCKSVEEVIEDQADDGEDEMDPESWAELWDTFAESPTWDELHESSQELFKRAWYGQMIPLIGSLIQAVMNADHQTRVRMN